MIWRPIEPPDVLGEKRKHIENLKHICHKE
jgi:hypothetical protein